MRILTMKQECQPQDMRMEQEKIRPHSLTGYLVRAPVTYPVTRIDKGRVPEPMLFAALAPILRTHDGYSDCALSWDDAKTRDVRWFVLHGQSTAVQRAVQRVVLTV